MKHYKIIQQNSKTAIAELVISNYDINDILNTIIDWVNSLTHNETDFKNVLNYRKEHNCELMGNYSFEKYKIYIDSKKVTIYKKSNEYKTIKVYEDFDWDEYLETNEN